MFTFNETFKIWEEEAHWEGDVLSFITRYLDMHLSTPKENNALLSKFQAFRKFDICGLQYHDYTDRKLISA